MKAILLIGVIFINPGMCSSNASMESKHEFSSMEACYESLAKANIPDNTVAICVPNE